MRASGIATLSRVVYHLPHLDRKFKKVAELALVLIRGNIYGKVWLWMSDAQMIGDLVVESLDPEMLVASRQGQFPKSQPREKPPPAPTESGEGIVAQSLFHSRT